MTITTPIIYILFLQVKSKNNMSQNSFRYAQSIFTLEWLFYTLALIQLKHLCFYSKFYFVTPDLAE